MSVFSELKSRKTKVAIVGLGYVGFPLALEFGKIADTIGFDMDKKRVAELESGIDSNGETPAEEIKSAKFLGIS